MCLDLRKLELLVVGVHLTDLISGWSAKDLNDLHELIHPTVTRKDWLTKK